MQALERTPASMPLTSALLPSGCTSDGKPAAPRVSTRDSAGIAIAKIRAGGSGLREYPWRDEGRIARWLVFETTGRVLGLVVLPAELEVFDIGDDYVLGAARDADDAQHIVVYRYSVVK